MHRNHKLLLLLGLLVMTSLALSVSSDTNSAPDYRVDLFQIADTSRLTTISISGESDIVLSRSSTGSWRLNQDYGVNRNLKNVLLAVLNQVNVRRPVSRLQRDDIVAKLEQSVLISLDLGDDLIEFYAGGNTARTQSYFMLKNSGEPYIVEIPGYRNYVSGIFDLSQYQWRDRTLFQTHWRSLQTLNVKYPSQPTNDVNIFYQDEFFRIEGVTRMDTTSLMSYLSAFELFEANEFIPSGFDSSYDSLANTSPMAIVELKEINQDRNQVLKLYPKLGDDSYVLAQDKNGDLSLIGFNRVGQLLANKADLIAN